VLGALDPRGLEAVILWGGPALIGIAAAIVGARFKGRKQPVLALVAAGACLAAIAAVAMATEHDPDVSAAAYAEGLVVAGVLLAALPFAAYYLLGRWLGHRRVLLGFVVFLSLFPLAYYTFIVLLVGIGLVHCPPDAYECPL
jgi:hypothetical protein